MDDISALKRLLFEAETLVMAQLREQVSNPDMQMTRKMPPVEREAKMKQLRARLPGVRLEHQLEPSHALLKSSSSDVGDVTAAVHRNWQAYEPGA